jgi:tRNA(Ile)-lysidine synthase
MKAAGPAATIGDEGARFLADLARVSAGASTPLALAVSGGPDSMALLTLAAAALPGRVIAATVDHGLRDGSAVEAAMVVRHCAVLGVPHTILTPVMPIEGSSLQARARTARYDVLARWARDAGAGAIATAHHADDQAETFLMRAARGSGLAGLAGIRPSVTIAGFTVVRPLLGWRRAELRAIVRRAGAPFVDDPANVDLRHDRTRFRNLLNTNEWLDPPNLARAAAALAEAEAGMSALVALLWNERAEVLTDRVRVRIDGVPREALRRLARRAIGIVREHDGITQPDWSDAVNIESLLDALTAGRRATQAGVLGGSRGGIWTFRAAPPRRSH